MNNETQVQIQNKFCLTIDEAVIYYSKWSEVSYQKETI